MKISKFFSYKEALYLPQWNRCATKKDGLTNEHLVNLKQLFNKMDAVREYVAAPIIVHVAFRPKDYNALVGGAKQSSHMQGMAIDFHVENIPCDDIRYLFQVDNKLEEWGMRCEDAPGTNWIHLDIREPGPSGRWFKP